MNGEAVPFLSAQDLDSVLSPSAALEAIEAVLRRGLDPAGDLARTSVTLSGGEFLLMPSEAPHWSGIKIVTVAPQNSARGLPRIQGLYLLFDAETLAPRAVVDGAALTALRTPAVSMAAIRPFLEREAAPLRVVVVGAGPQGIAHLVALRSLLGAGRAIERVTFVVRRPSSVGVLPVGDIPVDVITVAESAPAIAAAGLIICATTSRDPLFDGALVGDSAVVVAVGSHEPGARELDGSLMGRSHVIVEDRETALREAGDVILAIGEGRLDPRRLIALADVVCGTALPPADRPIVFKSTGMGWQDLAVAAAAAVSPASRA